MELDQVRKEIIARVDHVFPTCVGVALSNADFTTQYLEPYRAKRKGVIRTYEKKKKIVFCRDCLQTDKRGWILAYKLFITATDNPLDNKKNAWLECQCQHCDFDLITPTPTPQPAPETEMERKLRDLTDMLNKQQGQGQQQQAQSAYEQLRQSQQYWGAKARTHTSFQRQQEAEHMARMYGKSAMLEQSPRMFTDNKTCAPPVPETMMEGAKKMMGG